jgi:hypothetical protein
MPKKTTSKTETEKVTTTTAAPVVAAAAAPAEKKTKKSTVAATPAPVVVAPVVDAAAEPAVVDAATETPLADQSVEFLAKLQQLGVLISSLKAEYKVLEKKWTREVKTAQKQSSKRKRKAGNRAPSGFVKPTKISDELASFLGKDKGSEMARTDVTRDQP